MDGRRAADRPRSWARWGRHRSGRPIGSSTPGADASSLATPVAAAIDATGLFGVAVIGDDGFLRSTRLFCSLLGVAQPSTLDSFIEALPDSVARRLTAARARPAGPGHHLLGRIRPAQPPASLVELSLSQRSGVTALLVRDVSDQSRTANTSRRVISAAI